MRKVFITYGDSNFEISKKRVVEEAKSLGIFDEFKAYGPEDLPPYIKNSPLMAFERGGGYWCWKPYIIWRTMKDNPKAVVVYADAGCKLQKSNSWCYWFSLMDNTDTLVMAYRTDFDYGWGEYFGKMTVCIGEWTKLETRQYYDRVLGTNEWQKFPKIFGGCIFAKNNSKLIYDWLQVVLLHPELVSDPLSFELQPNDYILHRHDQSILTPIVYSYRCDESMVVIIPETGESDSTSGVVAARIHDYDIVPPKPKISFKTRTIRLIKKLIGESLYNKLHGYN